MSASMPTTLRERPALGFLLIVTFVLACYWLHGWLPSKIADQSLASLHSQLHGMGITDITAQHHQITADHVILHDVTLYWASPQQKLNFSHVLIQWQPQWAHPDQWITGLTLSKARFKLLDQSMPMGTTLMQWQQLLKASQATPWPIKIESGEILRLVQPDQQQSMDQAATEHQHSEGKTPPLDAQNYETEISSKSIKTKNAETFQTIGGFSLKQQTDSGDITLLVWLHAPNAQVFKLSTTLNESLNTTAQSSNAIQSLEDLSPELAPFKFNWQQNNTDIQIAYWPPKDTPTHTPSDNKTRPPENNWLLMGNGKLTPSTLKKLNIIDAETNLESTQISLHSFRLSLPHDIISSNTLPHDFSADTPFFESAWLNNTEGQIHFSVEDLKLPINTTSLTGDINLNGTGTFQAQPGNWVFTLNAPAQFVLNSETRNKPHTAKTAKTEAAPTPTPTPTTQSSATQLFNTLLPTTAPIRITGQLPARTKLTINGPNLYEFRAEDRTTFSLNSSAYSIRGTVNQLRHQQSDVNQTSGLFELDWEAPPARSIQLTTQAELQTSAQLLQLDLNGTATDAGLQWDLHWSLDAQRKTLYLNRLLVMNPFNKNARVDVSGFSALFPLMTKIAQQQQRAKTQAPPFGHVSVKTTAALPLPTLTSPQKYSKHQNLTHKANIEIKPLNTLIEPSLLFSSPPLQLQSQAWISAKHNLSINTQIDALKLDWLLKNLGVSHCEAKGIGQLSFQYSPEIMSPRQTINPSATLINGPQNPIILSYTQNTAGFLSCENRSNLAPQLLSLQPTASGQFFQPFKSLSITQTRSHPDGKLNTQLRLEHGAEIKKVALP